MKDQQNPKTAAPSVIPSHRFYTITGKKTEQKAPRFQKLGEKLLLVIASITLGYFLIQGIATEQNIKQVEAQYRMIQEEKAALLQEQAELKEELAYLQTDAYVAEAARSRLGMLRAGEIMFIIE
ncbi:MAG: septum formation initiator family protein [Negativicutes bacterium]|nr:septum formation initiator family protein [Negativicutes bacterium]